MSRAVVASPTSHGVAVTGDKPTHADDRAFGRPCKASTATGRPPSAQVCITVSMKTDKTPTPCYRASPALSLRGLLSGVHAMQWGQTCRGMALVSSSRRRIHCQTFAVYRRYLVDVGCADYNSGSMAWLFRVYAQRNILFDRVFGAFPDAPAALKCCTEACQPATRPAGGPAIVMVR